MSIIAVFVTTTDPPLTLRLESDGVVLDNVADPTTPAKRLYPRPGEMCNAKAAKEVFEYTKDHYERRAHGEAAEYVRQV